MKTKWYLQAPENEVVAGVAPAAAPAVAPVVPASSDDGSSALSPEAVNELLADDITDDSIGSTPDTPVVVAPVSPVAAPVAPVPAAAAPVAPVAPMAPVVAPAAVAPVVPPAVAPVVAPVPAAVVPPVAPVVPAPVVAPVPTKTQEQVNQEAAARRQEFHANLVEVYTGSLKDKGAQLLIEPEKVLPELAAELHQQVLESAIHGIMSQVPMMVQNVLAMQRTTEQNEAAFFRAWPQLVEKRGDAMPLITRFAPIYRQANPTASLEDFIREVGSMTMVALRIDPNSGASVVAPMVAPMVSAFAPAVPGSGGIPPAAPKPAGNAWESLHEEFLHEDRNPQQ